MGATNFYKAFETSKNVYHVIADMKTEAEKRYGTDPYNGTIATCDHVNRVVKLADTYSKSVDAKASKYIEKDGWGRKREISVLDLGVCGYKKITVKKKAIASKCKSKVVFVLRDEDERLVRSFEDKAKAVDAMMRYASEHQAYCYINRETVMTEGTPTIMEAAVTSKTYKSKPKNMTNVHPIHRYVIYGWAAD